jgi:predicted aspartyl protease
VVFLLVPPPGAVASAVPGTARTIPITLDEAGLVVVPVSMGALGMLACVLDTGASRTVVGARLAARLRLTPVARADVLSSAGTFTHDVVELPPVTLAGVTRPDLLATLLPDERMRELSASAACVIGQDFLASHDYTIDYDARTLSWDLFPDGCARSASLPLVAVDGRFVVELPQSDRGGAIVRLVPDSGASAIVLFRQPGLPSLALKPTAVRGALTAATGRLEVSAVQIERLRIGDIVLRNRPAFIVDRRADERTLAEGLLPLQLFARVSFRKSEGRMVFTAR